MRTYTRAGVITVTAVAAFICLIIGIAAGSGALPLEKWQALVAAGIALVAATMAWKSTTRQILHAASLERQRRSRKRAALRAALPLVLSEVSEYAERSAKILQRLAEQCVDEVLPRDGVQVQEFPEMPHQTVTALADFIEYSDTIDIRLFEELLANLQIHRARTRGLRSEINAPRADHIPIQHEIETYMIDAACIYAGAGAAYDYARRRAETLPPRLSWDNVRSAFRNMHLWDQDIPRVYQTIDRLAERSFGPRPTGVEQVR